MNNKLEVARLEDMVRGWFIGNFEPSLCKTNEVEVCCRSYKAGDRENSHYHKIATEFTVVLNGTIKMGGEEYGNGSIVKVPPGVPTDFEALPMLLPLLSRYPELQMINMNCKSHKHIK